jgi:hypothetical protein
MVCCRMWLHALCCACVVIVWCVCVIALRATNELVKIDLVATLCL